MKSASSDRLRDGPELNDAIFGRQSYIYICFDMRWVKEVRHRGAPNVTILRSVSEVGICGGRNMSTLVQYDFIVVRTI